jgi:hypothetical protein
MSQILDNILQSVLPAVISGGGTAISTIYAFARDVKKRVEALENRIGSVDSKTGLAFALSLVEESLRQVRNQIDNNLYTQRSKIDTLTGMETLAVQDQGTLYKLRALESKNSELEDRISRVEVKSRHFVSEADFEEADRQRANEITEVRNILYEVKGLIQGLQTAWGVTKK